MKRVLFVGDPHATPEELDDCAALMGFVERTANETQADEVCILGDLHHTHNVIRAEVMAFWRRWTRGKKLLVGNHDYAGEGSIIHALMAYENIATVVQRPTMDRGVLYLPYYADREAFLEDAARGGRTLVCHQTFAGSLYENGFYAEDGVNPDLVPQAEILSGHIHTPQTFGKVIYIGAPRWRSLNDANHDRYIWLWTFDDDGNAVEKLPFSTGDVCRQIKYVLDTPDTPFQGELDPRHDWRVDIKGPVDYVEVRRQALTRPGVRIRTFKTEQKTIAVRESEGIAPAFRGFVTRYTPKHGTPPDTLLSMAKERLGI